MYIFVRISWNSPLVFLKLRHSYSKSYIKCNKTKSDNHIKNKMFLVMSIFLGFTFQNPIIKPLWCLKQLALKDGSSWYVFTYLTFWPPKKISFWRNSNSDMHSCPLSWWMIPWSRHSLLNCFLCLCHKPRDLCKRTTGKSMMM